jgi:hypothetical protein
MLKSHFLIAAMAASLVACGGGSSGGSSTDDSGNNAEIDNSQDNQEQPESGSEEVLSAREKFERRARSACRLTTLTGDFSNLSITEVAEVFTGKPKSSDATVTMTGTASVACVDGSVAKATLAGSSELIILGDIKELIIDSVNNKAHVYGSVDKITFTGSVNDLFIYGRIGYMVFGEKSMFNDVSYQEIGSYDNYSSRPQDNKLIQIDPK